MNFLKKFYIKTIKYDLINKFDYQNTKKIPKLKKITLNFGCKTNDIKNLASCLVALELLSNQKSQITTTKYPNLQLKIRKGNPTGCKITLRKNKMFNHFFRMLIEIFPKLKNFEGLKINKKLESNSLSYDLYDIFNFQELEEHYYLFSNIPRLSITITTDTRTKKELLFIFNSIKLPFRN
jgi:large subunit ribosomal protein L5